jgi:hypothetical protein
MRRAIGASAVWLWLAVGVSCRPSLDDRPWLITRAQILAVKAEPPEVRPGTNATFEVVALDPAGAADTTGTTWTLCQVPKPPAEANVVATGCVDPGQPNAVGSPVTLAVPTDACQLFGPDTPQPAPGASATRPRDPDATGGYYQPITIALANSLAVGLERVTCDLPSASLAVARQFAASYTPNQNPTIAGLTFTANGAAIDPGAVPAGAGVAIEVSWSRGSAETFPVYDRTTATIAPAHETLTASWYVTGGDLDRAAIETSDPNVTSATATWTAPPEAIVRLAITLRDSRGGIDAVEAELIVNGP